MGQILVRNVDDAVIKQLKSRAAQKGTSLEQTVREIISDAVRPTREEAWAEIDRIRAMSKKSNVSSVSLIRGFRDGDDPGS